MKRFMTIMAACGLILSAAMAAGCAADASADTGGAGDQNSSSGETNTTLWSKFDGTDIQIWSSTFTADTNTTDGLVVTVGSAGWWGGSMCNSGSAAAGSAVTFDMSKVAKITFDAKGSAAGSFWISNSDSAAAVQGQTAISLTADWTSKSFSCASTVSSTDYAVFDIGGGDLSTTATAGYVVYMKNIAFWDSDGNEIVPTRNE